MPTSTATTWHPTQTPSGRFNRVGGDVEVRLDHTGDDTVRIRGTWRRLSLQALWATPVVMIEAGLLVAAWVALPVARPVVLAVAAALLLFHGWRGLRQLTGVLRALVEVDRHGIRGSALGRELAWEDVVEVRRAQATRGPVLVYVTAGDRDRTGRGSRELAPSELPTELLLDVLVPADVPVALGHPDDDPRAVTVADDRLQVELGGGRTLRVPLTDVTDVDVTAAAVGNGRVARQLEVLAVVDGPRPGARAEELVTLPETLARRAGLVDALDARVPGLESALRESGEGRATLWSAGT
ncbi:hypothetical protein [Egicoccus halophilus]|uniref:Uncharacterized protein n=1 Tax=Egicoccus halophilus TaxID=1670830 RepID=A0A8J3AAG2_9ACTN|nr:hypothetical protein [Egicoccus halophilus]GGI08574.1 hypothetical protein GCM10011354_29760 [Egicoccus halophilus]